jgi:hypothetical protein
MTKAPRQGLSRPILPSTAVSGRAISPPVPDPQTDLFPIRFEELLHRTLSFRVRGCRRTPSARDPIPRRQIHGGPLDIAVHRDEVHLGILQARLSVPTGSLKAIDRGDAAGGRAMGQGLVRGIIAIRTTP